MGTTKSTMREQSVECSGRTFVPYFPPRRLAMDGASPIAVQFRLNSRSPRTLTYSVFEILKKRVLRDPLGAYDDVTFYDKLKAWHRDGWSCKASSPHHRSSSRRTRTSASTFAVANIE